MGSLKESLRHGQEKAGWVLRGPCCPQVSPEDEEEPLNRVPGNLNGQCWGLEAQKYPVEARDGMECSQEVLLGQGTGAPSAGIPGGS